MKKSTLTLILVLTVTMTAITQSIQERTENSDLVIEGKVVQTESYWNNERTQIYTSNLIEVSRIFKGDLQSEKIEIITKGGYTENAFRKAFHSLQLSNGMTGVFFCKVATFPPKMLNQNTFEVNGGEQGFIQYHSEKYHPLASDYRQVYRGDVSERCCCIKNLWIDCKYRILYCEKLQKKSKTI